MIENSLHHLLEEYADGNELSPLEIGFDSTKDVIWIYSFGHDITESPHQRVRRGYCPICGKARNGSFAQNFPDFIHLWSSKNNMDPYKTPPTYTGLITWTCENGHMCQATPEFLMRNHTRCPVCSSAGFNNPDIIAE